eukprot:TRINITY_DN6739_c0_g1_i3.p1 TRINITY_DN6739_c0_g1~~TRINITY_DN6739_c0_g1_i3.p1  ORF type:complete len:321 (+),score=44.77 TRINITY_DN6739_c0_g1_i3:96-965(+)
MAAIRCMLFALISISVSLVAAYGRWPLGSEVKMPLFWNNRSKPAAMIQAKIQRRDVEGWRLGEPLLPSGGYGSAAVLQDGRVLQCGNQPLTGAGTRCRLFDPATESWSSTGSMIAARGEFQMVTLHDGRVLAFLGIDLNIASFTLLATSEVYDPATGIWTQVGSAASPRWRFAMTHALLSDGRLLVGGITDYTQPAVPEVFDPSTGQWTVTGPMTEERDTYATAALPNGKALSCGGWSSGIMSASCEIYEPGTNSWRAAAPMPRIRFEHELVLLPDGKVLAIHGQTAPV